MTNEIKHTTDAELWDAHVRLAHWEQEESARTGGWQSFFLAPWCWLLRGAFLVAGCILLLVPVGLGDDARLQALLGLFALFWLAGGFQRLWHWRYRRAVRAEVDRRFGPVGKDLAIREAKDLLAQPRSPDKVVLLSGRGSPTGCHVWLRVQFWGDPLSAKLDARVRPPDDGLRSPESLRDEPVEPTQCAELAGALCRVSRGGRNGRT